MNVQVARDNFIKKLARIILKMDDLGIFLMNLKTGPSPALVTGEHLFLSGLVIMDMNLLLVAARNLTN